MRKIGVLMLTAVVSGMFTLSAAAAQPKIGKLTGVPFSDVKTQDEFWSPRLATNRERSIPHNLKWCEQTGRISNFEKAAGKLPGKFEGIYFNDSDLYKVLEGVSYSLADHPDPALEKQIDEIIAKIAAAQQPNGYLNTYFTLVAPDKRWTNTRNMHELYCAGHLFEGAVAHYRATGKRTFLDVAVKLADHIDATFGPEKLHEVPGHEEIELALVKLYQVTGQERYLNLARFFLDIRGDQAQRKTLYGPYHQDHVPVRQQSEIVGHAVRAMYLFSGVADVAGYTGDQGFIDAMDRLWQDVVLRKMYVTGGVGARHAGEAFGDVYELPNRTAYCETCAAIGLALWAHRLNLMHADAKYADVLETAIYNGILSGIGMDGEHYFYVNPLESTGNHHRQPFFGCACCPTNVVRFVPSVPGYVYAHSSEGIFVNLYMAGTGKVPVGQSKVTLTQETRYPWDGRVQLTVQPDVPGSFGLFLRIPGWCQGAKVSVNGQPQAIAVARGYAPIHRQWKAGDRVVLDLPMDVQRVEAHPLVKDDASRVALRRGPIVYCLEAVDNDQPMRTLFLARDPKFVAQHRPDLLGGVTVVKGFDHQDRPIVAVPYYAWDHREPGPMLVWIRQDGKSRSPKTDDPAWAGKLYRPMDAATLGPSEPLTPAEQIVASASFSHAGDAIDALHDGIEPKDSCDHAVPRFTWWGHRGTKEWVQYEFPAPQKFSAVSVYWFDDERLKRGCRVPESWKLLYQDGDAWKPVAGASACGTEQDKYNRTTFQPVTTKAIRIEVQLKPKFSGGILEWRYE